MAVWSDENCTILKTLWEANELSASQIGAVIGCTRSAVIGKAHRLKLEKKTTEPKGKKRRWSSPRRLRLPINRLAHEQPAAPASRNPVTLDELQAEHCRFPLWEASASSGLYCGDPRFETLPYCMTHCMLCYTPARPR